MRFETERLILRKPRKNDWKDVVEGVGELDVARHICIIPHPYKKKDALEWINKSEKEWKKKNKTEYCFVIELKSEKKVIGGTSLHNIHKRNLSATTGSWINKKYWKKGYITEAKIPILDFAFNKLKLRRVQSDVYKENIASNNMAKKFGYKLEGTRRKATKVISTGKIHDENVYGLLKEDWKKARAKMLRRRNGTRN